MGSSQSGIDQCSCRRLCRGRDEDRLSGHPLSLEPDSEQFPGVEACSADVSHEAHLLESPLSSSPSSPSRRRTTIADYTDVQHISVVEDQKQEMLKSMTRRRFSEADVASVDASAHENFLQVLNDMLQERIREKAEMEADHNFRSTVCGRKTLGFVEEADIMPVARRVAFRRKKSKSHDGGMSTSSWQTAPWASEHEGSGNHGEARRKYSDRSESILNQRLKRSQSVLSEIGRRPSMALQIMIENPRDIYDLYHISKKTLGKGSFGVVKSGRVKATNAVRAVKSISKREIADSMHMLKMEIKIAKIVDHPNAIKLYEIFEDALNLYLVMEMCNGGSLLGRVKQSGRLTEKQAAICMHQIFCAVLYLHNSFICHRDIKPDNVLVEKGDVIEKADLKVSDFGISCMFKTGQVLKGRVGTMAFMAPEVIQKKYDPACDVWSCGVMLFYLLSCGVPFVGQDRDEVYAKICKGRFAFAGTAWVDASQETMDFVRLVLTVNPKKRPGPKAALHHGWFQKHRPRSKDIALNPNVFKSLVSFKNENKFTRAAYCMIVSFLSRAQCQSSHDYWTALDHDGDGILTQQEVKDQLQFIIADKKNAKRDTLSAKKILKAVEENGFSDTSYTEFMAATFDRHVISDDVLRAVFSAFDQDCNGTVTLEELSSGSLLGGMSLSELGKLVDAVDTNGDGEIDFAEFRSMMIVA